MRINLSELITEQRNPNSLDIDLKSTEEIVDDFSRRKPKRSGCRGGCVRVNYARVFNSLQPPSERGGRLFYIGAGTSGRLGVLDASECPPTFSTPPDMVQGIIAGGDRALRRSVEAAEDKPDAGAEAIRERGVAEQDVLVGIASSGYTPYVIGALKEAHKLGAKTIFPVLYTRRRLPKMNL